MSPLFAILLILLVLAVIGGFAVHPAIFVIALLLLLALVWPGVRGAP